MFNDATDIVCTLLLFYLSLPILFVLEVPQCIDSFHLILQEVYMHIDHTSLIPRIMLDVRSKSDHD